MTTVRRALASISALTCVAILTSACLDLPSLNRPDIPDGIPPGLGTPVPFVDINAPGRTAEQLRDWARPISDATGIPFVALESYGNAAEIQRQQHPECGIGWTTLAGIGGVESKHGQYRGSKIAPNGDVSPPIRGVPLDGTRGNMEIPDTDGGKLDGDATHDRAMGPFQFIPETWRRYGVDANGDGRADPDNIDDAALSAARYLCVSAGGDMTTPQGWEKAVKVYNNSMAYVIDVRDHANAYSINVRY
ncbi:lytic murein transglycosylase [Gordonia sp. w5E2]|uniref:Murein transglycosylase n=1 Tax=Gordonia jacobaea TaxID=122202 RepID=A0ABR5IAV7_9ACTN|nr:MULTISPECIES: lytic murein transglycosylase [Gordonia]SKZ18062.1 membrane-bound lytic murein transglycosylase B [Mycobacteroides abscessus subsp. abscessus]KNA90810.1 murein transglycosylase [Gordonia jacobaea]MCM3897562.1 lytic murein transglycosylase [Gordonia sputi]OBC09038.1 murein transglycosylase [Gordonia sp. 852002-50816_SCH5313054-a]OBC21478.1 murein transglycosylase [Gordonia sp. 852002-50816_SCH5313054-c]